MSISLEQSFDKEVFKKMVTKHLSACQGVTAENATEKAWFLSMVHSLSELSAFPLVDFELNKKYQQTKKVNYLSLEFLIGRLTGNALLNLGIYNKVEQAMAELGFNLVDLLENERDPSLGNGGLGRLAACFMDSLVTQEYPAVGYGLYYQYGLFKQSFDQGYQVESPDAWLNNGSYPWQIPRADFSQTIGFYGHVESYDDNGITRRRWLPSLEVKAFPWDLPIIGYKNNAVYPLRLWQCLAVAPFSLASFNNGDYFQAQHALIDAGNITKVLYPNDNHEKGKTLRLKQQYFHSSASIKDILRRHESAGLSLHSLPEHEAIQLNDTHPTISIPELMRLLIDEKYLEWDEAWAISSKVFSYTNHTLLPEALETWSESLLQRLLPRHMEIIYEINHRFLQTVSKKWPNDVSKLQKLSIIEDGFHRQIRMANLGVIGSCAVNGVAQLHSSLVKSELFPEFDQLFPDKIKNVTNGITPRRWLLHCNPELSAFITDKIGDSWVTRLEDLQALAEHANDPQAQKSFMAIKRKNKEKLAQWVAENLNIKLNIDAIFDVQIKRLHEYKRQHLNLLHILSLYHRIIDDPSFVMVPRVFFFAAKAAPGYYLAKEIIYAINKVAEKVNNDPRIGDKLKVVFIPDYRVSVAELMIPAADVSEQISTAGKEASGTGNMKLALNGALTIGTLDGANVEILEEVGADNIYIFGMSVDEVRALQNRGYNPHEHYLSDPLLKTSLDLLLTDEFTQGEPAKLRAVYDSVVNGGDPYFVAADFSEYVSAHERLAEDYTNSSLWAQKAMLNTARMGKFSSDRSIQDYVDSIWKLERVKS